MTNFAALDASAARIVRRLLGDQPQRILAPVVASVATLGVLAVAAAAPATSAAASTGSPIAISRPAAVDRHSTPAGHGRPAAPAPAAPSATAPAVAAAPAAPPAKPPVSALPIITPDRRGALPVGKGMWIYLPQETEGGDANAIVAKAVAMGLTHLYVRTGSSPVGFYAQDFLNQILPVAHAHGIRVFAWDYPYFKNNDADIARAVQAITYTTPTHQRVDGFSADIEYSDGTNLTPATVRDYGARLRRAVGPRYPLIATVERPNPALIYPFADAVASFDAVAPMIYWLNTDPIADLDMAFAALRPLGKPIMPIGQAYDGAADGGPPGIPNRATIQAFMAHAEALGAVGVSFWSWQAANAEAFGAIRDDPAFSLATGLAAVAPGQMRAYQTLLSSLGYTVPVTGLYDARTKAVIAAFQQAAHLPPTGIINAATRTALLTPTPPPIQPQ